MPYIGPPAPDRFVAPKAAKQFSGDGSTTAFTLDHAVGSDEDILVSVDGVIQEPSVAYAVSNGTTLTFTAAPSNNSGNNIFVYYLFRTVGTVSHPSNNAFTATNGTLTGTLDVTGALTVNNPIQILNGSNVNTASTDADDLIIEGPNDCGLSILSATTGRIFFGDASNDDAGSIRYVHSDDSMRFEANDEEAMRIHSIGAVTKPLQPAFHAHKNGTDVTNLADGDTTITWGHERFDQNGDFASNTFTAPVTGKYFLQINARFQEIDKDHDYIYLAIKTSNQDYSFILDPDFGDSDPNYYSISHSVLADMDANDTAYIRYSQNGGAAQTDLDGNQEYTWFEGYLVC